MPAVNDSQPGCILVVHRDRKAQREIHRILGGTRLPIEIADDAPQGIARLGEVMPKLLMIEHHLLGTPEGEELQATAVRMGAAACVALMSDVDGTDLPQLFAAGAVTNLMTSPMPLLAEELSITALKLLKHDLFGLEKYLGWGTDVTTVELSDAAQRSDAVDGMGRDLRGLGLGQRVAALACLIADELMSNAIYNAPIDATGARLRVHEPRYTPRPLEGRDRVTLRYACDGRYLALEVTDLYGSIQRQTILRHLAKSARPAAASKVEMSLPGAGMGLGLAYSSCNHLVFNVDPGQRTEVVALIDVRFAPPRGVGTMASSFNVFVAAGGEG